ncbi:MAG: acyltransferase [Candidatus Micrarchaeia archaeon]
MDGLQTYLRLKGIFYGFFLKKVGANFKVDQNVYLSGLHNVKIGDNITIGNGSFLVGGGGIEIGDNVLIAQGVKIYSETHKYQNTEVDIIFQGGESRKVTIGKGSWLGANSIILPGIHIGKHCVVGAGSVVTKNIPDFSVVVGVPARIIKKIK